ncbi:MAG: trypsin-like serine protease [Okeania sp. SIO3H1]|nr:trypsin-like serine protease [Okeania sp. SIO3H1]
MSYLRSELGIDEPVMFPPSTHQQIVSTIKEVNPAVVSVVITKDIPIYERYYETFSPFGGWWGSFQVPRIRESGTEEREVGGGSGFIVTAGGVLVTNRHVVDDVTARYSVLLNDGTSYDTEVLWRDDSLDIAVLQISNPDTLFPYVTFGDSTTIQLGETVIAIGNALAEFQNSVSVGVVSGLSRTIIAGDGTGGTEQLEQVIQTDAAINPGNSGGPLINISGEVIGVNVATSRGADNISFALPAHVVQGVVEQTLSAQTVEQ